MYVDLLIIVSELARKTLEISIMVVSIIGELVAACNVTLATELCHVSRDQCRKLPPLVATLSPIVSLICSQFRWMGICGGLYINNLYFIGSYTSVQLSKSLDLRYIVFYSLTYKYLIKGTIRYIYLLFTEIFCLTQIPNL